MEKIPQVRHEDIFLLWLALATNILAEDPEGSHSIKQTIFDLLDGTKKTDCSQMVNLSNENFVSAYIDRQDNSGTRFFNQIAKFVY